MAADSTQWQQALTGSTMSNNNNDFSTIGTGCGGSRDNGGGHVNSSDNGGGRDNGNYGSGGFGGCLGHRGGSDLDDGSKINGDSEFDTCFNDREGSSTSLKVNVSKLNDKC